MTEDELKAEVIKARTNALLLECENKALKKVIEQLKKAQEEQ